MGRVRKRKRGVEIVKRGRVGFGTGVSIRFDKTLTVDASARDCMEFAGTALREWYAEAMRTGKRFDSGMLPRDSSGWVGHDTGLLATRWRAVVVGGDVHAGVRVFVSPPDAQRAARLATLAKDGIHFSGLSGHALDVYTQAVATYMADVISAS